MPEKTMLCPCCHTEQPAMGFQAAVKDGEPTEVCEGCVNSEFYICTDCQVWVHQDEIMKLASGWVCEECDYHKEAIA